MAEYLFKVVNNVVVCSRGITHDKIHRLQFRYFFYCSFVYIFIETSHKIIFVYNMDCLAGYLLYLYLCRKFYAEVEHNLEQ